MSSPTGVARATLCDVTRNGTPVEVHFNPTSLQITLANTLGAGDQKSPAQYVTHSSAKLALELVFDTTDTGADVRDATRAVAAFLEPVARGGGTPSGGSAGAPAPQRIPPVVEFDWGTFNFRGIVESYRETLDFFSADGVPLRASVGLTLARQDLLFDPADAPRRPSSGAAIGFAAGAGISAGLSAGVSGGVSLGISGGVSASAGVGASAGAFAGLRAAAGRSAPLSASFTTGAPAGGDPLGGLAVGGQTTFGVGGRVTSGGTGSLRASVGASGSSARLRFEG